MSTILVVEDNEMVANAVAFKLKREGYEVVLALDGREAKKELGQKKFELIITDIMLPYMNGIELIEYAKTNYPSIPIIVLSVANQEKMVMNAFQLGVEDFISKPFNPNELILRVKRVL
ncbi:MULTISPECIES: response regulator transcription factor [Mesonia]|uniref:Alkaline phosphatase synthesis transcriptional regulatory protein PhoP n=1 Tax=Mesonia oceanica TaxID=2687242 RepID=A0AC61Y5L4_9FLAO|nr:MULTISPECIES: response regulator [Mesonia]MAN28995.1 response regulator [Mesonia sp.]MAQ42775.1 response regulator [Mesonia sp.]MBJ99313.1 response regulator [Flavobacteriaceae bacterium]VVU99687.1 Alkaline phosphatase synthesis transcriptional regulatory protein PhoP [Mesonia oceanica]|tara:strand:+ start:43673 stop:44026 length:354 start_codon:yes stop_codon:yes gene_type:complete